MKKINSGSNATEKALTIVTLTTQKFTFIYIFHPVCAKLWFVAWCLFDFVFIIMVSRKI